MLTVYPYLENYVDARNHVRASGCTGWDSPLKIRSRSAFMAFRSTASTWRENNV
jgi:hypothetical protein